MEDHFHGNIKKIFLKYGWFIVLMPISAVP